MSNIQFTNFAATTLASGINSAVTSLTVASGTGALFPTLAGAQYFYCVLADAATGVTREVIKVTARSTDTFTITRAQDGTTGQTYITGDKVELRLTAAGIATLATTETAQTFAGVQTFSSAPVLSAPLAASGGGTGVANNAASTITMSGNFASTFVVAGANSYTLPNASDTLVNLGSTQTLTNKTLTGCTGLNYDDFKNRIINGAMAIDQRNAAASQTFTAAGALAYSVDRWYGYCTGANVTGQQVAGSTTPTNTQFRYKFTGAASVTAVGFGQRIEQKNSYDLAGSTCTLSADLAISATLTTVTWTASYATTTADTFGTLASPTVTQIATGTFTVSATVTNFNAQISVPSAATTGIQVVFTVGALTAGLTWTIGNVQLEKGATATSFNYRSIGAELALCQRYYEKTFNQTVAPAQNSGSYPGTISTASTGTSSLYNLGTSWQWKVVKRTTPTITSFSVGAATSDWYAPAGPATVTFGSGTSGDASVYIQANAAPTSFPNIYYVHMTAAAEL